ncbi:MAG TPA: hypothetical protein VK996_04695 [Ramlibacter sp.]|nr:hypothetical protein [Ramlibacter sp.]
MTAAQLLSGYGLTMDQAHEWLLANIGSPQYVLEICQAAHITNSMLGEIAGWPGAPIAAGLVQAFFAQYSLDSSVLEPTPAVVSVSSDSVLEGGSLLFNVTLSSATTAVTELSFALTAAGVGLADFSGYSFTNGVAFNGTALVVPAGVSAFTLELGIADDSESESEEGFTLTIGGVSATGAIADDDSASAEVVVQSVSAAQAAEGSSVVHTISLSAATTAPTIFLFSLNLGTIDGNDLSGSVALSNGVTMNGSQLIVPAGVSSFTLGLPAVDDTDHEPNETFQLTVGGVTATGTIVDNDEAPAVVTVLSVSSPSATEGSTLTFNVTLSGPAGADPGGSGMALAFSLGGTAASGADYQADVLGSAGVSASGNTLYIEEGTSSFTVRVFTNDDTSDEADETVLLSMGDVTGTGTLLDNDEPAPSGPSVILPSILGGFTSVLDLNDHTGVLSTLSLRTAILGSVTPAKYWAIFDPARYGGTGDGTLTAAELGVSHLGNLPATAETIESLFYGTFIDVATSIDFTEAGAIGTFFFNNLLGITTRNPATISQYVALFVDAAADPAALQAHPDGALANQMIVGMVNATAGTLSPTYNVFDALLTI